MTDRNEALLAAQESWRQAMLAGDAAALDTLVAEDIVYTHGSGKVEDKAAYIATIRSGTVKYGPADLTEIVARHEGDLAWIDAHLVLGIVRDSRQATLIARYKSAWSLRGGEWKMVACTYTPIPKAAGG